MSLVRKFNIVSVLGFNLHFMDLIKVIIRSRMDMYWRMKLTIGDVFDYN